MAKQTFLSNSVNANPLVKPASTVTTNGANGSQEYKNYTVEASADKFAPRYDHKEPLRSSGLIDQFNHFDSTPSIGTEFPDANLVDWINSPNSDQLIRDLAIKGERNDNLVQKRGKKRSY